MNYFITKRTDSASSRYLEMILEKSSLFCFGIFSVFVMYFFRKSTHSVKFSAFMCTDSVFHNTITVLFSCLQIRAHIILTAIFQVT